MSAGERPPESGWGIRAAICALALTCAPLPASSASVDPAVPARAPRDTIAVIVQDSTAIAALDTTASAEADTSAAAREKALRRMEELKGVLSRETGSVKDGAPYTERKSGRVAMACALLVPGLGQMYNEKPVKAAIALGLESFYLSRIAMNRRLRERERVVRDSFPLTSSQWNYHDGWMTEYYERSVDWIWWSGAVILAIVIDAYVDAKLDDMRFKVEARASGGNVGVCLLVRY